MAIWLGGGDEILQGGAIGLGMAVGADFQQDDALVLAYCQFSANFRLLFGVLWYRIRNACRLRNRILNRPSSNWW